MHIILKDYCENSILYESPYTQPEEGQTMETEQRSQTARVWEMGTGTRNTSYNIVWQTNIMTYLSKHRLGSSLM